jgi:hypothetical protein
MTKVYKRTIYWFNATDGCGAIAVDQDGFIYELDTAPKFRWMARKKLKFSKVLSDYRTKNKLLNCKKIDVEEDPF